MFVDIGTVDSTAAGDESIVVDKAKYDHSLARTGVMVRFGVPAITNVGGQNIALTTEQAYCVNPFPAFWLWDVVVTIESSGNVAGEQSIDVYNTRAAGSSANSYLYRGGGSAGTLNGAIPVGQNIAALTAYSARRPTAAQITAGVLYGLTAAKARNGVIKAGNDPYLSYGSASPESGSNWTNWLSNFVYPLGAIFSVRAKTPNTAGAQISGVRVEIIGFASTNVNFVNV